jgi:hypothetical protein
VERDKSDSGIAFKESQVEKNKTKYKLVLNRSAVERKSRYWPV